MDSKSVGGNTMWVRVPPPAFMSHNPGKHFKMSDDKPTAEENAEAVYAFAADQMRNGLTGPEVVKVLVENGLEHETAAVVVEDLTNLRKRVSREAGQKNMLIGALWCGGGLAVTAITFSAASGGGVYVVTWGAVIFGAIQFLRGVGQMWGD